MGASGDPVVLLGSSDVAAALGVGPAVVTNWIRRHADTPAPDFVRSNGSPLWRDLAEWHAWHERRQARRAARDRAAAVAELAAAERRVAEARAEVERLGLAESGPR